MKIARVVSERTGLRIAACVVGSQDWVLLPPEVRRLDVILHAPAPLDRLHELIAENRLNGPLGQQTLAEHELRFLNPIDSQEVWAAGVTYKRSQQARMEESEAGASHYDKVYEAPRPEIFFKATPARTAGPGEALRVRSDSGWSVPEPELALVISPAGKLVGFTIGNDMSARDIEGENPLYLPQAKVYNQCCGLGPCIRLADGTFDRTGSAVELRIERGGAEVFRGQTTLGQMRRTYEELIGWLLRENHMPTGAILLTGTGIVPPDAFTLQGDDRVAITIQGIGQLHNGIVRSTASQ